MRIRFVVSSLLLVILTVVFGLGCASTRPSVVNTTEDLVWPLPPDPPKIEYVRSIHSEMDVGWQRSLARRIFESLFGRPPLRALKKPLSVHADALGRVLVVDTGWRRVLRFDFDQNRLEVIGNRGKGMLLNPLGVTTDDKGRIYVTDAGGYRVLVYDRDGQYLGAFGGKKALLRPAGIAVNSALGLVYVVDVWAHQIKVFGRNTGNLLFTIGKKGQKTENLIQGALDQIWNRGDGEAEFRFPTWIAIGEDGRLYVVDTMNFRVQILEPNGKFIRQFGEPGNWPGAFYRPKGIGLDSDGHIYVADAAFNNVQIFDQEGRLLLNFGTFGSGLADLRLPAGLYVDSQDRVYVVDQYNHRVQVYQYLGGKPIKGKRTIAAKERR